MKPLTLFLAMLMVGCQGTEFEGTNLDGTKFVGRPESQNKQRIIDSLFDDIDRRFAIIDSLQKANDSILLNALKRSSAQPDSQYFELIAPVETLVVHDTVRIIYSKPDTTTFECPCCPHLLPTGEFNLMREP